MNVVMRRFTQIIGLAVILIIIIGCKKEKDEVKDIEGNVYHTVTIGTQVWMVENLKTTRYKDGSDIPHITGTDEWKDLNSPGYCWYDNDIANLNPYGALYNWYVVNTGKLCPEGWHVPTADEWYSLVSYVDPVEGNEVGKLKETGTSHWNSPNTGATNETGLALLPGGGRDDDGVFQYKGMLGQYYSLYEDNASQARGYIFFSDKSTYGIRVDFKTWGHSVRCIKD